MNLKEIILKYKNYIIIGVIIILIIIIGFIYSNKTTIKYEKKKEDVTIENKKQIQEINTIKIDIKGEVEKPNVYEMNENDRIIDVINKAGGLKKSANTNYLNLAKKLKDEMVIIIYSDEEIKKYEESLEKEDKVKEIIKYQIIEKEIPCPNTTNDACINKNEVNKQTIKKENTINDKEEINSSEKVENNELVNINTASKEQLMTLPSIGESKADLIIDYRNEQLFEKIEDIKNVKGIGDSLFEKIKDHITI